MRKIYTRTVYWINGLVLKNIENKTFVANNNLKYKNIKHVLCVIVIFYLISKNVKNLFEILLKMLNTIFNSTFRSIIPFRL